jgi:FkbM family methyltransferase
MQTQIKNFSVTYKQETEFNDLKREIFERQIYYFETNAEQPVIVDAGAHIGLATLYFKWLYPSAKIMAVEPNPDLVRLLEQNVQDNRLENVEIVMAAIGKNEGKGKFFIDETDWRWWSTGSLYAGAWNGEQKNQLEITVTVVKLRNLVQKLPRVDLLKLDIEGAEMGALLGLKDQWQKIAQLIIEWHPRRGQDLGELLQFLRKKGYEVKLKDRKNKIMRSWGDKELLFIEAFNPKFVPPPT